MPIVPVRSIPDTMNTPAPLSDRHEEISLILRDFLKVIKAVCLYPANNSLPQSLRQSFASRLLDTAEDYGRIRLEVDRSAIGFEGEVVHRDRSREENLAAIFFDAGITEFTFTAAMTVDDLNTLFDTLKLYLNAEEHDHDLAALLWEAEINGFGFATAEDIELADYDSSLIEEEYFKNSQTSNELIGTDSVEAYVSMFAPQAPDRPVDESKEDPDGVMSSPEVFGLGEDSAESLQTDAAARAMGLNDLPSGRRLPDTTLLLNDELKLSEEEEARMKEIREDDARFDAYKSTATLVKEMFLQEIEIKGFMETITICAKVLSETTQAGRLDVAAGLLRFVRKLESKIEARKPLWTEKLRDIFLTIGSRDRLKQLTEALNSHERVSREDLAAYLSHFDWHALSALTDLLGTLEHRHHREALCDYLVEQGRSNVDLIAKGMFDKKWYVVRNSVLILGHIGGDKALAHLRKAVDHEDRRVRHELVTALQHCPSPKAATLLKPMVTDPDAEIRQAALRSLMCRDDEETFLVVSSLVTRPTFAEVDPADQTALLIGYSKLGKERAVAHLAMLARRLNPWRNAERTLLRKVAFIALAHNPSEKAERLLESLAGNWRPDIKRKAQEALQKRRAMTSGGSNDPAD